MRIASLLRLSGPRPKRKVSSEPLEPSGSPLSASPTFSILEESSSKTRRPSTDVHFRVGDYLVQGAISVNIKSRVHKATNVKTLETCAVKIVDQSHSERLIKEFNIGKELDHPNVVKFFECIKVDNEMYIFMEYCGETLESYTKKKGKLLEQEARHYFIQLVDAVAYCHKMNVLHGDVKLSNVLVHNGVLKLVDFDVSKSTNTGERTTFCGETFSTYSILNMN